MLYWLEPTKGYFIEICLSRNILGDMKRGIVQISQYSRDFLFAQKYVAFLVMVCPG